MKKWSLHEEERLKANYPSKGKKYCCDYLKRGDGSIRRKASNLGLQIDKKSEFFQDFQKRAAISKVGKKRPLHSMFMKSLILDGKMPHIKNPSDVTKKKIGLSSAYRIKQNGHPRGMLGKKHSHETIKKFTERDIRWHSKSEKEKESIIDKAQNTKIKNGNRNNSVKSSNAYSRTKSGKREDLGGIFFRSSTEANFARYLTKKGIDFEFEPKAFYFEGYKRGTRSYTPDFYIPKEDIWYEVKGWLDSKSMTKLKRFKKHYPKEFSKLYIVKQVCSKKSIIEMNDIGFTNDRIIDWKTIEIMKNDIPGYES